MLRRVILMVALATSQSAIAEETLKNKLEMQRIYRSAYFLGRGDTGIANADNHEALFYNPAGLALGKGVYKETVLASPHVELSNDTRNLIREMGTEGQSSSDALKKRIGSPQHLGIYNFSGIVFRRVALGGLVSAQTNLLVSKSEEAGGLEQVDAKVAANQAFVFSIAESFFSDHLLIGVTSKFLKRGTANLDLSILDAQDLQKLDQNSFLGYGNGTGADIGFMYKGGSARVPFFLGLTVENAGDTQFVVENQTNKPDNLKQTINVGFAIESGTRFSRLRLLADYRDATNAVETNPLLKSHAGIEISVKEFIGFTTGINQGYPTVGFYANLYFLRVDVGSYTEELGDRAGERPDPRFFVRICGGF